MSRTIDQISEVGGIIKEVVKEEACLKEILALIYSGYYLDEQVFLYDLLYSQESRLFKSKLVTEQGLESSKFKARYLNTLNNISGSKSNIQNYDKNLTIYFPYSKNFKEGLGEAITFVFANRDGNVAKGKKIDRKTNKEEDVSVDEAYAMKNPTFIIGINSLYDNALTIEHKIKQAEKFEKPISTGRVENTILRVNHLYGKLSQQLDALISFTGNGGGSEIYIGKIDGYLKPENQQITSFDGNIKFLYFSRSAISSNAYVFDNHIWDFDWELDNTQQVYAVWEEDTQGTKTFSGSLQTRGQNNPNANFSYNISITSQDAIVRQLTITRSAYLATATLNQGCGFSIEGWPFYECNTLWAWAWKYQIL